MRRRIGTRHLQQTNGPPRIEPGFTGEPCTNVAQLENAIASSNNSGSGMLLLQRPLFRVQCAMVYFLRLIVFALALDYQR